MILFDTAANIINDAAVELGLIPFAGKVADPFNTTGQDPNIGVLCQLLKGVGRHILREAGWTYLQQTYTFTTVANVGRYALPSDYDRYIPVTGWNRTNRLPLGGPLGPSEYEFLKARLVGVVFTVLFRVLQQQFQAYPDTNTPGGYVIAYEYISRWWVQAATVHASAGSWNNGTVYPPATYVTNGGRVYLTAAGGTSGTSGPMGTGTGISDGGISDWAYVGPAGSDQPTASTDTILFDPELVKHGLKAAYLVAKGYDASGSEAEYQTALDSAIAADVPAAKLSLNQQSLNEPLLGQQNVPLTGFGSVG